MKRGELDIICQGTELVKNVMGHEVDYEVVEQITGPFNLNTSKIAASSADERMEGGVSAGNRCEQHIRWTTVWENGRGHEHKNNSFDSHECIEEAFGRRVVCD